MTANTSRRNAGQTTDLWGTPAAAPAPPPPPSLPRPPVLSKAGSDLVRNAGQVQRQARRDNVDTKNLDKLERLAALLKTREPTGAVPWPLILLEGGEKAGKTWQMLLLSASPRVGQMFLLDVGEGRSDEYANIPGVSFLFIEHDGSLDSIVRQVRAVHAYASIVAMGGGEPVVLGIDSMTLIWEMIKSHAAERARYTDTNRAKLLKNPNAEIAIPGNAWDDAHDKRKELMHLLMTFPGIVVCTARGKEIAAVDDNGHFTGKKAYKVDAHKDLPYDVSCHIRLSRDHAPMIVSAQSVHAGIRPDKDEPKVIADFSLERVIFDILKCDPTTAHPRDLPIPVDRKYLLRQINTANADLGRDLEFLENDFQRHTSGVPSNVASLDHLASYWDELQLDLAQLGEERQQLLVTASS